MFDFDGTLSAVVEDPAEAAPRPGVVDHLAALVGRYLRVGVISGRPVSFLESHLPGGLFLSGLYGMEESVDGEMSTPEEFLRWQPAVGRAVAELDRALAADRGLDHTEVEDKGLSVTVHYRRRPEAGEAITALAERVAETSGLELRPARMSIELHPPVPTDKGHVLRRLVGGFPDAESAIFVGDDVGDLPAFDALALLRSEGLTTAAVAIASSEMDPRMQEKADVVIDGSDVEPLLEALRYGVHADD